MVKLKRDDACETLGVAVGCDHRVRHHNNSLTRTHADNALQPDAEEDVIKKAYKTLAFKWCALPLKSAQWWCICR